MSSPTKRKRALALECPSTCDFTAFGCDDEEAFKVCDGILAWLCEPASLAQVADRSIFLERLIYYKRGLNMGEAERFKRVKSEKLPSFSDIQWDDITQLYKLGSSYETIPRRSQLATCYLPFTLHRKIKCAGWTKMDVNGDVAVQLKEAGIVNIASYAIEAVLALFSGRIINKSVPGTPISSGGRVEFQLYTIGNILVVVCKFKKLGLTNNDAAQLFAKMISAAEANQSHDQDVHGMLSNLEYHHFYTYSPATKTITMGPVFTTASKDRLERLNYMVDVVNYLFTICLDSFITFVRASRKLSVTRQDVSDVSSMYPQRVADLQPAEVDDADGTVDNAVPASRPSTLKWEKSDEILRKAQTLFKAAAGEVITVESINTRGSEGLSLLQHALQEIPRLSSTDGKSGPKNLAELVALIDNDSNFNESWQAAKWQRDAAEKSQKASG